MTFTDFNLLNKDDQLRTVWDKGIFLDNFISETLKINCYAIDMFFVEVVYNGAENKILEVRSFKEGYLLDKYAPRFKTKF